MRRARFGAVVAAMALVLSGCGGGSTAAAPGTLTINMATGKTVLQAQFNPLLPSSTPGTRNYLFEPLMGTDPLKGGALEPWLATSATTSTDGRTLTIKLDPRANWSDGSPLTASDVVFTFTTLKQYPAINLRGATFSTVTAADPHTVVFTFDAPAFTQVGSLVKQHIVPEKYWKGQDPLTWTNDQPVGSGPYKLERLAPQQVSYTARTDYWQQRDIAVKTLRFPVTNSTTEVSQLEGGALDLSGGAIPNIETQFVQKNPATNKIWYPTYGANLLIFNHEKPVFGDVRVRRAIAAALDKQQMIDLTSQTGAYPISQTALDATTQSAWLDPRYNAPIAQDQAGATALLEQAGYRAQDGKAIGPDGKQLSLSILEVSDYADSVQRDRIIADQLGKVGIALQVQTASLSTYNDRKKRGDFDLITGGVAYGSVPWDIYNPLLNSTFSGAPGKPAQTDNFGRWRDPATDAVLNKIAVAPTKDEQVALTRQLEGIIAEQVPFVTLSNITAGCAYTTKNWTGFPSAESPTTMCAPWYDGPDAVRMVLGLKPAS